MIILSKVVLSIFAISSVATTTSAKCTDDDDWTFTYDVDGVKANNCADISGINKNFKRKQVCISQFTYKSNDNKKVFKVCQLSCQGLGLNLACPSEQPSKLPSNQPSVMPSDQPSKMPSAQNSAMPSDQPSKLPSEQPSKLPSDQLSKIPSDLPSKMPSKVISYQPSKLPSNQPSVMPSDQPSKMPSAQNSAMPSAPTTSVPSTTMRMTSSPTTSVPVTSAPTTSAPITSGPITSAPTTSVPTTTLHTTSSPTTSVPVTSAPTTSAPITSGPITSAPTTSVPSTTMRMTSSPTISSSPTFTSSPSLITFTPTTSAPMTFSPITFNKTVELLNDSSEIVEETTSKINESCLLMPKYDSECDGMLSTFSGLAQSISAFNTTSDTTMSRRLEDIDDSIQDDLMIKLLGVVGTAMNALETTLGSVNTESLNLNFDNFLDEIVTLIQDVTEKNPQLVTPVPSSAPTITSAPTHTSNQPSIMLSDQPSTSNQPAPTPTSAPTPMTSSPTTPVPTTSAPKTSSPTTSAPTTSVPVTSAPTTTAPTTSAPTTSVPKTSVPTTSAPTTTFATTSAPTTSAPVTSAPTTSAPKPSVTPSIRSPHPTYDYSAVCVDASECAIISQLSTAEERKKACVEKTSTCPIACGDLKCYKFTQACKDFETEKFTVLKTTQKCKWIKYMKKMQNPLVPWICLSAAVPMNSSNVALDYSYLAQDRCQESCKNPACTCGDRTFPFWTEGYDDTSDTMSMVDDNTTSDAARERNCKDLYNMTTSERDTVCELDIRGVTAQLSTSTNDIPAIIKVNYMCPKACGNRLECFCTDSTDMIPTPNRANVERQCHWAENWSADKLAEFCDESIEPYFARACAVTCKNPRCVEHDSTYSLELFGNVVSTTCRQIYEYSQFGPLGKGEEYVRLMCGAKDYGKMLFTHELCPMACKDVDYS